MKFIIRKKSRDTLQPYCGPACEAASIEPGKVYLSQEEANADAVKLSAVNPVGFEVQAIADLERDRQ